jgi:hypothetical protein
VALCLYDQADTLAGALRVDGEGALCGDEPCWTPIGKPARDGKGFVYEDKSGSAGGSSLVVDASNHSRKGETALPTGIADALARATQVTLQLHTDAGCFEGTLSEIQQQESDRFEAK